MENRSLSRRRFLALSAGLAGLLLAIACGGAQNKAVGDKMAPPEQQVLRLRLTGEPKTIDPHLSNGSSETTISKALFAGLFTYNEQLQVVPNVAAELPTDDNGGISKDGLTYTVKLRKDVKWSDGKAVTADDFVYSLRRALDPKLASPYVSFLWGVAGAKEYNTALGTKDAPKSPSDDDLMALRDKVSVSVKDNTIVYQLKEPNPSFLNLLALWTAYPVRQDVVEKYGNRWTEAGSHIGNGAFKLAEWTHDQRLVFEPNPYWHGEKPALRRVIVNFIADDTAAFAAYKADEIDVVNVPPSVIREAASSGSPLNQELRAVPALSTYALIMNHSMPPFDSPNVRQAFAMAIDRNAYVDGVLQGAGKPTTSWIPPGMPGYNPEIGKQYEFNPIRAKQLLAAAGYPDGRGMPKVTFIAVANDTNRIIGQFIEDQLKRNLGVEVTHEFLDSRTYGMRFTGNQHQVTIQRWNADWPYPDNWLPDIFGSDALNNHAVYKSSKFDELVHKAAQELDEKKRLALYNDAHKLAIDESALAPLYNPQTYILVKPRVKQLVLTALDGNIKGDYNLHKTYIGATSSAAASTDKPDKADKQEKSNEY